MIKRFFSFFLVILVFFIALNLSAQEENTQVIVCDNGLEMFNWNLEFIHHAQQSIDISACFLGGEIARKLLTAIEARLELVPTIQVSILTTPILIEEDDFVIINRLKNKYPQNFRLEQASCVTILWPDVSGIDNHVKVCVIDEEYFSIGGTNLDGSQCSEGTYTPLVQRNKIFRIINDSLPAGMRDQDIVGKGPIAKELREAFCKIFSLWHYYNQTGKLEKDPEVFLDNPFYFTITHKPFVPSFHQSNQLIHVDSRQMKFLLSGPHQATNSITEEYVRLIQEAKKEIKIANLYLCPVDAIFNALLDAVNRGIKLTIITNGMSEISPDYAKYFCWANRLSYLPLFQGEKFNFWHYWSVKDQKPKNTRIYEYHVKDVLLHKKILIIDEDIFALGSYNLGLKSHLSDYEALMVIHSSEVVKAINRVYTRDLEHSLEVSYQEAVDWYFNPSTAYLGSIQKRFSGLI
ncbi:MAG: phosphatidylserine/phosphatidylglycerophosphate/cardiolipin synthase family protein [Chlamydiales bacterium]